MIFCNITNKIVYEMEWEMKDCDAGPQKHHLIQALNSTMDSNANISTSTQTSRVTPR